MAKKTYLNTLSKWLSNSVNESTDKRYRHRCLKENLEFRAEIIKELQTIVHLAHEDARNRLRNLLGLENTLDPFSEQPTPGTGYLTIDEYPRILDIQTLKGYLGEIFAAIIAENLNPFEEDWQVPVFPFRFHDAAFHELEKRRQIGGVAQIIPGRIGDDMLAFQRDASGKILRSLVCEAKCTRKHSSTMIEEAHEKASEKHIIPVYYGQLIDILKDYADIDTQAAQWVDSLRKLRLVAQDTPNYERCDLVSYICGVPPVRESTVVIPQDKPHEKYTAGRRLEAVEIHVYDVEGLIEEIYQKQDDFIQANTGSTNFNEIWQQVIACITPTKAKSFVSTHCQLLNFDGQKALIGVSSLLQLREALRKEDDIKDAFSASGIFQPSREGEKI